MCEVISWSKDLAVEIAGQDVMPAALRIIADRTGLTAGLSRALARRGFVPVHDRGRGLADTAVLIARRLFDRRERPGLLQPPAGSRRESDHDGPARVLGRPDQTRKHLFQAARAGTD